MALESKAEAALALNRFGLGPRTGSIAAIASDPRGALIAELDRPGAGRVPNPELMSSAVATRAAFAFQQAQRELRRNAKSAPKESQEAKDAAKDSKDAVAPAPSAGAAKAPSDSKPDPRPEPKPNAGIAPQQIYLDEAKARLTTALDAEIGFVERLAWFWSNHFCVSADKAGVRSIAGAYEREAIRANVLGRFVDMLRAVETHPAMLLYLDNARSIGPTSQAGKNRGRGLNENLAREILELHTLGVRTVYSQDDVLRFAKVITGWTMRPMATDPDHGNEFVFNTRLHEPGPQTIIDKTYPEGGVEQGKAVLADLARHPATAAHVAAKLARHFCADEPPDSLTERLAKRFLETDGNLKEIAKALVEAPETWDEQRLKLKRPSEWLMSAWRAIGTAPEPRRILDSQAYFGERLWRPVAPQGFSDMQAAWIDGLAQRLDIANRISERLAAGVEPADFIETALGPLASADTRQTIARAESRQQALTLALMSPEFQRR